MTVEYALEDEVALIHLARPGRLNAVTAELVEDLLAALARAGADGARVVVLAGRGRAFCAGHDLREPARTETPLQVRARIERLHDVTRALRAFDGPVLAAVHGYALGAGCELALACDVVVADAGAQLGFPEVGVGLSVTGGISRLLVPLVGLARAKDLLLLGERVDAPTAERIGLVSRLAPAGEHERVARELAARLVARPPLALALARRALDAGLDGSLETAFAMETDHALLTGSSGEGDAVRAGFGRG